MALGADRYASRGDTFAFLGCVLLSVAAMSLPERIRDPLARGLRQTVLAPFLALQQQTELLSASLARYDAVVAQRDSAALAATFLPELRSENTRLRSLLGLGTRLSSGYVPAEVLHEPEPSRALTFIVSAGTMTLTSGLGGVLPRGVPIGTVVGVAGEAEGWERAYLIRPAVHPAAVTHVMILTGPPVRGDLRALFESSGETP